MPGSDDIGNEEEWEKEKREKEEWKKGHPTMQDLEE